MIDLEISDRLASEFNILKVCGWCGTILICWGLVAIFTASVCSICCVAILTPGPLLTGRLVKLLSLLTMLMVLPPRPGPSLGTMVFKFPRVEG